MANAKKEKKVEVVEEVKVGEVVAKPALDPIEQAKLDAINNHSKRGA